MGGTKQKRKARKQEVADSNGDGKVLSDDKTQAQAPVEEDDDDLFPVDMPASDAEESGDDSGQEIPIDDDAEAFEDAEAPQSGDSSDDVEENDADEHDGSEDDMDDEDDSLEGDVEEDSDDDQQRSEELVKPKKGTRRSRRGKGGTERQRTGKGAAAASAASAAAAAADSDSESEETYEKLFEEGKQVVEDEDEEERAERQRRAAALKSSVDERGQMVVESSDSETSEDEMHSRNTLGRIPLHWYDDYEHMGYDLDGNKVAKPSKTRDRLDKFLERLDSQENNTVYNPVTGEEIELSEEDIKAIRDLQQGRFPGQSDPYEPYVDFFTYKVSETPVSAKPEPKRRFIPSKWEHKKIMKIVRAIRKGWIKPKAEQQAKKEFVAYDIWKDSEAEPLKPSFFHIPAPKLTLPGHEESYNPPEEYLPTAEEAEELRKEEKFVPRKYTSLRLVPAYDQFIQERFHRCLDLYLCPRAQKIKLNIDPDSLIPKLPSPKDLRPFPSRLSQTYEHPDRVTCLSFDPTGQFFVTGCDDKAIRFWEVLTGRCRKVVSVDGVINGVAWSPNVALPIVAVAVGSRLLLINPTLGPRGSCAETDRVLRQDVPAAATQGSKLDWTRATGNAHDNDGLRFTIQHSQEISQVTWHHKGNYVAAVCPGALGDSVAIHSVLKRSTQLPFKKKTQDIQRVCFHPKEPVFFVATKTHVRIYNLHTQTLVKRLVTGVKWLSSMAVHPGGDNVLIGSYDRRLAWFDLDLSVKPYKTLRYHKFALRQVCFHKTYPLFASCSDDGTVHIFHGMVYSDLLKNPLIVPVKILRGHDQTSDGLGVMDCQFHPRQPWIATAGADGNVQLFT